MERTHLDPIDGDRNKLCLLRPTKYVPPEGGGRIQSPNAVLNTRTGLVYNYDSYNNVCPV
jgi:hypothetical protein